MPPEGPEAADVGTASHGSFWKGLGIGFLLHTLQILAAAMPLLLLLVGVTQLAYMIPAMIYFRKRTEPDTVKGLVTAAAVTFLANAGCWGFFMTIKDWK